MQKATATATEYFSAFVHAISRSFIFFRKSIFYVANDDKDDDFARSLVFQTQHTQSECDDNNQQILHDWKCI